MTSLFESLTIPVVFESLTIPMVEQFVYAYSYAGGSHETG